MILTVLKKVESGRLKVESWLLNQVEGKLHQVGAGSINQVEGRPKKFINFTSFLYRIS